MSWIIAILAVVLAPVSWFLTSDLGLHRGLAVLAALCAIQVWWWPLRALGLAALLWVPCWMASVSFFDLIMGSHPRASDSWTERPWLGLILASVIGGFACWKARATRSDPS